MENIRRFVRLATSVKGVTRRYIVSQLFLVGMVICNLFIPQMIQTIADEGIAKQDLPVVANTALPGDAGAAPSVERYDALMARKGFYYDLRMSQFKEELRRA
jgi:hypothetical protein